ncbi:alpha-tubulin N-acetyltransferase [Plasmodium brasilianum]|uniref:Alpha-tubulin N-acetyltransferase n=1 Tax=Plasmodium brasilianum TaxID=5824 RepID=A0ACB9YE01_PLABR|nr:alpha-tubulin N-acetyltransferase [Plasmodium brasilianum]
MKCVPSNKPPGEIKQLQIKKFTRDDLLCLRNSDISSFRRLENDVHKISHLSSKDQKLYGVLTSLVNIMDNDYKLYIGTKNLYLYDKKKLHYRSCTCVLDFYIMKDFQKRGLGIVIKKYYGKMGKIQNAKTIKRQSYDDKAIMTKRLQQSDYNKAITTKR